MKKIKAETDMIISTICILLLGIFVVINNVFEYNFISQPIAYNMFFTGSCTCLFILYFKRNEISANKRQIMKYAINSFLICVCISIALSLLFGLTIWTKIIILLLWFIVCSYLLFIIYRKK